MPFVNTACFLVLYGAFLNAHSVIMTGAFVAHILMLETTGELAVENKRIKPYYEYMYPQLADEGDYTYMFQKYKTGGEFR